MKNVQLAANYQVTDDGCQLQVTLECLQMTSITAPDREKTKSSLCLLKLLFSGLLNGFNLTKLKGLIVTKADQMADRQLLGVFDSARDKSQH